MINTFDMQTQTFHPTFCPYCIKEWAQLNDDFKQIDSIQKFKQTLTDCNGAKKNFVFFELVISMV